MSKKEELEAIKKIVEEESVTAFVDNGAQYEFHHLCGDLGTVFIYELPESEVPVEFEMVKNLEKRLKVLSAKHTVGIFYQGKK